MKYLSLFLCSVLSSMVAVVWLLTQTAMGQTQPPEYEFSMTLPTFGQAVAGIGVDNQGNVIAGSQNFINHIYTGRNYLTKYDDAGAEVWEKEFQAQFINGVYVDELGDIYATGDAYAAASTSKSWLGKFAPDGTTLWTQYVTHGYEDYISNGGLVRDAAGNFYSAGTSFEETDDAEYSDRQMCLRKWSPTGESLWFQEFGTEADEEGDGLAIDGSGNIYLFGSAEGDSSSGEPLEFGSLLLKKISSDGNLLWERTVQSNGEIYANDFVVDISGNIFIGGATTGQIGDIAWGDYDGFVGRWDTDGNLVWAKQYGTAYDDRLTSLILGKSQTLLIAGYEELLFSQGAKTYLTQLDYEGNENWSLEKQYWSNKKDIYGMTYNQVGDLIVTGRTGSLSPQGFIELLAFPKSADIDNDGDVDGRDFLAWQRGIGTTDASLSDGDANGDGLVDAEDLAIWQEQYAGGNSLSAVNVVPESGGLSLILCSLLFTARLRVR